MPLHEHFQTSLIVHSLILILIGFAGIAIATFSSPRGTRSKTLCTILCCILTSAGIVGAITTSAREIKWLEQSVRVLEESRERDSKMFRAIQQDFQKNVNTMRENERRLLGQLAAQGELSQESKKKIDAALFMYGVRN